MEWNELKIIFDDGFKKVCDYLLNEFSKINSGRINPNIFNNLLVNSYGEQVSLRQLANIQSIDARQILIKPYDRNLIKEIAKALSESEFHVNPQVSNDNIRIIFAPLTRETRIEAVKKAKESFNQAMQKIRLIRQDVQSKYKKNKDIVHDDIKFFEEQLNKITKEANNKLENLFDMKQKELLSF